ncbi:MAG: pentapeptide repeat-containing protein [Candidatus Cloacimonetes bacterium]|nr:pentapeptide repeat-containing protein [Candidatus Cloacimonadota bacterium]
MFLLLREGKIEEFNRARETGTHCDLAGLNFRAVDLRGAWLDGLDLTNCYFRQTDLRGVSLHNCQMEGASIHAAHISGTFFPRELSSSEIRLSLQYGTRMRYSLKYADPEE